MRIDHLKVTGYRSLRDASFPHMGSFTVIYGDNNTGKSNVLAFLETLFSAKSRPTLTPTLPGPWFEDLGRDVRVPQSERREYWIDGEIPDFCDNFFQNSCDRIAFEVGIQLSSEDVSEVVGTADLGSVQNALDLNALVVAQGAIARVGGSRAWMSVDSIVWGDALVYDRSDPGGTEAARKLGLAQECLDALVSGLHVFLTDSVVVIDCRRFLTAEQEDHHSGMDLHQGSFKNVLFNLCLDREHYHVFTDIASRFECEPFSYGKLTFARRVEDGADYLELMVEKGNLRIPIDRLGSGVQQALMIIASLVANENRKVFGLEEPEINLSSRSQEILFGQLLGLVNGQGTHVHQLLVTSHSPVFGETKSHGRRVTVLHVSHDGSQTVVTPSDRAMESIAQGFQWYQKSYELCEECILDDLPIAKVQDVCNACRTARPKTQGELQDLIEGIGGGRVADRD